MIKFYTYLPSNCIAIVSIRTAVKILKFVGHTVLFWVGDLSRPLSGEREEQLGKEFQFVYAPVSMRGEEGGL